MNAARVVKFLLDQPAAGRYFAVIVLPNKATTIKDRISAAIDAIGLVLPINQCIKRCALNAEMIVKCLLDRLAANQFFVIIVLLRVATNAAIIKIPEKLWNKSKC